MRRNAVLAINGLFKLPKGELLLPDAPELIEKVLTPTLRLLPNPAKHEQECKRLQSGFRCAGARGHDLSE